MAYLTSSAFLCLIILYVKNRKPLLHSPHLEQARHRVQDIDHIASSSDVYLKGCVCHIFLVEARGNRQNVVFLILPQHTARLNASKIIGKEVGCFHLVPTIMQFSSLPCQGDSEEILKLRDLGYTACMLKVVGCLVRPGGIFHGGCNEALELGPLPPTSLLRRHYVRGE